MRNIIFILFYFILISAFKVEGQEFSSLRLDIPGPYNVHLMKEMNNSLYVGTSDGIYKLIGDEWKPITPNWYIGDFYLNRNQIVCFTDVGTFKSSIDTIQWEKVNDRDGSKRKFIDGTYYAYFDNHIYGLQSLEEGKMLVEWDLSTGTYEILSSTTPIIPYIIGANENTVFIGDTKQCFQYSLINKTWSRSKIEEGGMFFGFEKEDSALIILKFKNSDRLKFRYHANLDSFIYDSIQEYSTSDCLYFRENQYCSVKSDGIQVQNDSSNFFLNQGLLTTSQVNFIQEIENNLLVVAKGKRSTQNILLSKDFGKSWLKIGALKGSLTLDFVLFNDEYIFSTVLDNARFNKDFEPLNDISYNIDAMAVSDTVIYIGSGKKLYSTTDMESKRKLLYEFPEDIKEIEVFHNSIFINVDSKTLFKYSPHSDKCDTVFIDKYRMSRLVQIDHTLKWFSMLGVEKSTNNGVSWINNITPYYNYATSLFEFNNKHYYVVLGYDNLFSFDPITKVNSNIRLFDRKVWITNLYIEDDHFYVSTKENGVWKFETSIEAFEGADFDGGLKDSTFLELIEIVKED